MIPEWVCRLFEVAKANVPCDFVGQIEINVFKGGISNVNVKQSFKEETAK